MAVRPGLGAVGALLSKRDDVVVAAGAVFGSVEGPVIADLVNSDDAGGALVEAVGVEKKDSGGAVLVEGAAVDDEVVDEGLRPPNNPGPPLALCVVEG